MTRLVKKFRIANLTFREYAKQARKTAQYPGMGKSPNYPVLGVAGEAGEVAEKWKKVLRNQHGRFAKAPKPGVITKDDLAKELGDTLWYIAAVAAELDIDLETVARRNLEKVQNRAKNNAIKGTGDER